MKIKQDATENRYTGIYNFFRKTWKNIQIFLVFLIKITKNASF